MIFRSSAFLMAACLGLASLAQADDASLAEKVAAVVKTGQPALEALAANKDVVGDVSARDGAVLSKDQAKAFQVQWVALGGPQDPFKPYLDNKSAAAFRAAMKKTPGLTKLFSLDKAGNVVATVPKSHDFVHGFEPKFLDCFKSGKTVVNKPALDLTSKAYSVQISAPIQDGQGATLGVLVGTFGIR